MKMGAKAVSWSRSKVLAVGSAAVVLAGIGSASTPSPTAAVNSHASCIGIEASEISPPGTSSEFPGGMHQVAHLVRAVAGALGIPSGAIYSSVARLHAGSHEACDAAAG